MEILIGVLAFLLGGLVAWIIITQALKSRSQKIVKEAEAEAEVIRKDKILQANEKFLQLKAEHEKEINSRNAKMLALETKVKQKETALSQRYEEYQRKKKEVDTVRENLDVQLELVERKSEELERMHKQQVEQLESISGMSAEEAKEMLMESLKAEAKTEAMSYINDIMDEAKINANKDRKSTRLNSSHVRISYAVFCLKKKKTKEKT